MARQALAIYASGDRTAALAHVTAPALVIHGEADPVFQLPAGRATAAALPQRRATHVARHETRPAAGIWPTLVAAISQLADRAKALAP